MKNWYLFVTILIVLSSCKSSKPQNSELFWARLEEDENYLFRKTDLTSISDAELKSGTVILFGETKGDFQTVYTSKKKKAKGAKHYLYKPKYTSLDPYSSNHLEYLVKVSENEYRSYITGERGGCYYENSRGNRIYVERHFCNSSGAQYKPKKFRLFKNSTPSGGNTHVRGHYRKTKSGKTIYVKPHTRRN